jgi:hypothetical protein
MMIYFPLFLHRPWFGIKKGMLVLFLEYFPVIMLTPLTQVIHDLQLAGYVEIFNLYYIYPLFLGVLVLITRILNDSSKINEERERLQHFQKALKGILSSLKLVRSTEEFGVILQKATKLLAELLGYKEALISVINQETKNIERIGYYGMKKQDFEELQNENISADALNALFNNKYEYGVFHIVNEGPASWYEAAKYLFELKNVADVELIPSTSADYPRPAKRPKYSLLLNSKFIKLRNYKEALVEYLDS